MQLFTGLINLCIKYDTVGFIGLMSQIGIMTICCILHNLTLRTYYYYPIDTYMDLKSDSS